MEPGPTTVPFRFPLRSPHKSSQAWATFTAQAVRDLRVLHDAYTSWDSALRTALRQAFDGVDTLEAFPLHALPPSEGSIPSGVSLKVHDPDRQVDDDVGRLERAGFMPSFTALADLQRSVAGFFRS